MYHGTVTMGTVPASIDRKRRRVTADISATEYDSMPEIGYSPADSFASIGVIAWRCTTARGSMESLQLRTWKFSLLTIDISTAEHDAMLQNRPRTSPLLRTSWRCRSETQLAMKNNWNIGTFPVFDRSQAETLTTDIEDDAMLVNVSLASNGPETRSLPWRPLTDACSYASSVGLSRHDLQVRALYIGPCLRSIRGCP